MGWQQKGSRRKRNSKSGHALNIRGMLRLVIAKAVCSKDCGYCKKWYTTHTADTNPPEHNCQQNFERSSGSMEPQAVLEMYKWLYYQRVIVARFVADDDSSVKAKLKWSNPDHMANNNTTEYPMIINSNGNLVKRPDHGKIPRHMPEPTFVADPNHRRKMFANDLHALVKLKKTSEDEEFKKRCQKAIKARDTKAKSTKKAARAQSKPKETVDTTGDNKQEPFEEPANDISPDEKDKIWKSRDNYTWNLGMTKMDVRRLSTNFGFMSRTLHKSTEEEILLCGSCVLEHHFDNHEHCGDWCRRKKIKDMPEDDGSTYYRCKTKHAKLYARLQSIVAHFITLDALKEIWHTLDTCANESFNNTISWLAPKKVYCGSESLKNRISIAIGISTLGMHYVGLFNKLGIEVRDDIHHHLSVEDTNRANRLERTKTKEFKRKKKAAEYELLKQEKKEYVQSQGIYQKGIGMTGGYQDKDTKDESPGKEGSKSRQKLCSKCKLPGHLRPTNKKCKYYKPPKPRTKNKTAEDALSKPPPKDDIELMANELDQLDRMSLNDDGSEHYGSDASEFSN